MDEELNSDVAVSNNAPLSAQEEATYEALVEDVAKEVEPKAKTRAAKKPGRRSSDETIDTLVNTVNTLAGSVNTLASTVDSLGEKVNATVIVEQAPAPVSEPVVVEVVDETSSRSPLLSLIAGYAATVASFGAVGAFGWAAMNETIHSFAIATAVVAVIVFTAISVLQDRKKDADVTALVVSAVAAVLIVCGLGFMIGGIQLFVNSEGRAAILVPVGLALSAAGFIMRSPHKVSREHAIWMAGAGVWICLGLFAVLQSQVPKGPESATPAAAETASTEAAHGEEAAAAETGHGEEAAASTEHAAEAAPAVAEAAPAVAEAPALDATDAAHVEEAVAAADHAASGH